MNIRRWRVYVDCLDRMVVIFRMINDGDFPTSGFVDPFEGLLQSLSVIDGDEVDPGRQGPGGSIHVYLRRGDGSGEIKVLLMDHHTIHFPNRYLIPAFGKVCEDQEDASVR